MAKDRSDKSKYLSRYSEGYVSAGQYITELICEKKATSLKKELPVRFWKLDEWASYFRNQIGSAHKLLKQFHEKAIIKALNNPKARSIYSLRAPHLLPIIKEEQAAVEIQLKSQPKEIPYHDINEKPRERHDPLSKLMELDDG